MTKAEILQQNINAVRELTEAHREKRDPNIEILKTYKGFGGISEFLHVPGTKGFESIKPKILQERIEEFHALVKTSLKNKEDHYNQCINEIRRSVLTAFYTQDAYTKMFYDSYLKEKDIKGNLFMDPSAGIGTFMDEVKNASTYSIEIDRITAAILDKIYHKRENHTTIHSPFQDVINEKQLKDLRFDIIATNAPFGRTKVSDSEYLRDKGVRGRSTSAVHDYFMIKNIDRLKKGGHMLMITSTGIADGNSDLSTEQRKEIISEAKLINIIRLPNNAFEGTKVNSDIYILEKRNQKLDISTQKGLDELSFLESNFINTTQIELENAKGETVTKSINNALWDSDFRVPRENLIGEAKVDFFNNKETIVFETELSQEEIQGKVKELIDNENIIDRNIISPKQDIPLPKAENTQPTLFDLVEVTKEELINLDENHVRRQGLIKGDIYFDESLSRFVEIQSATEAKIIPTSTYSIEELESATEYHKLVNSYNNLLSYHQYNSSSTLDTRESKEMATFIEKYNNYIEEYGNVTESLSPNRLSERAIFKRFKTTVTPYPDNLEKLNEKVISGDVPDWRWFDREKFLGISKEEPKNEPQEIKEEIEVTKEKEITFLSIEDGIKKTLNEKGLIDTAYLSKVTGISEKEVVQESIDNFLLYPDPVINTVISNREYKTLSKNESKFNLVTRDEFLSGPVRFKIEEINANAKHWGIMSDAQISAMLTDLRSVEKPFLKITDLDPQMGESWIPNKYLEDFASELFDTKITITKSESTLQYLVQYEGTNYAIDNKWSVERHSGRKIKGTKIMETALTGAYPKLTYTVKYADGSSKSYPDKMAMLDASNKINEMQAEWVKFLSRNEWVAKELEIIYNNTQNLYQERTYNGSHLEFPNLINFKPRAHQKDGVWQMIAQNGGLVDHAVGAGKTLLMALQVMEMKRLGISNKTMIIAMKANAQAIAKEFKKAYPNSKVLCPTAKDYKKATRLAYFERMKEDWDAIILTHDQFLMIPQNREVQIELINNELENIRKDLDGITHATGTAPTGRQLKGLETRLENREAELKDLLASINKDPDLLTFDKMGIDHLMVDESQAFKNLTFTTRFDQVAGLGNPKGSQRAFNLLIACRTLQKKFNADKGITFLSGTPISNSLVELYLLFKYLKPRELERRGMENFDEWARTFSKLDRDFELTVTNEIKTKDRFRFFLKVPELATMYRTMANVVTGKDLNVDKPSLNLMLEEVKPTEQQKHAMKLLVEAVKNGDFRRIGYEATGDNIEKAKMLIATNLATQISLDMRLLDPELYGQADGSKINHLCHNVVREYKRSDEDLGTQFIFLDRSTPTKEGFNMYDGIKKTLIEAYGIPEHEIQFIHDHDTNKKKAKLFKAVNNGEVRVIIGSTQKMGTGVNMQQRCVAMHHVDIPWNPKDFTQRNGRGERQGNLVAKKYGNQVNCYVYATEQTLDAYKYYLMDLKARFIDQIKTSDKIDYRTLDEGDMGEEGQMSAATFIAKLSGQEELLEKTKVDKKLSNLKALRETMVRNYNKSKVNIEKIEAILPKVKAKEKIYKIDAENFKNSFSYDEKATESNRINYVLETPEGEKITGHKELREYFKNFLNDYEDGKVKIDNTNEYKIGDIGNFELKIKREESENFMVNDGFTDPIIIYPIVLQSKETGEIYSDITKDESFYRYSEQRLYTSSYRNAKEIQNKVDAQERFYENQTELLNNEKETIKDVDITKYDSEINALEVKSMELHKKIIEDQMNAEENENKKGNDNDNDKGRDEDDMDMGVEEPKPKIGPDRGAGYAMGM